MNIDILITTFERPQCIKRLLKSIYTYYPNLSRQIYIADQSEDSTPNFRVKDEIIVNLPYDVGLSYARNYLFDNTPSEYKLLLDDDFEFTNNTSIEKFVELVQETDTEIVGGLLIEHGKETHFEYDLVRKGNCINRIDPKDEWRYSKNNIKYKYCDIVFNFGLFDGNVQRWDEDLKLCEHTDYYIRYDKRVVYTPDVSAVHHRDRSRDYKKLRDRSEFLKLSMDKHGIEYIKENGYITQYIENGRVVYKTPPHRKRNRIKVIKQ